MPRVMTDEQAAEYPSLAAATDRVQVLADAARLYAWVQAHPLATIARLRIRAQTDGLTAERTAAALAFLVESGQLVTVPDAPIFEAIAPRAPRDLEEFKLDELQTLAALFEVPGRSSMTRDELIAALRAPRVIAEPPPADAPPA